MVNIMLKTLLYFVLISSCFVMLFSYFVNVFYVNEEILNIPNLQSSKNPEKLLPEKNEEIKSDLKFTILHEPKIKKGEKKLIMNKNYPELVPFDLDKELNKDKNLSSKKLDTHGNNNLDKPKTKNTAKNKDNISNLKKFRVQLGSFKNKDKAIKAIKDIKINFSLIFKDHDLEIYSIKKKNFTYHRVWSGLMLKKDALNFCKSLKEIKVNCILQIDEG